MALNYSKLEQNLTSYTQQHSEINWYPGVDVSNHAWNKRQVLKRQMDEFCTFMFGGCDAWENFGAFIITDKRGDTKFYNGPSYTNKYSSPQFSSASGNLLGIDFKQQTISFKIGLYYFTIEDYQLFLDFLGAYKVDYLSFGFADKWSYLVKPSAISDSPRYVMETYYTGSGVNQVKHYWYYTELILKFEVQGPACAQYNDEYHWGKNVNNNVITYSFNTTYLPLSLLDSPFTIDVPLYLDNTGVAENTEYTPAINAKIQYDNLSFTLFDIKFNHLQINNIGLILLRLVWDSTSYKIEKWVNNTWEDDEDWQYQLSSIPRERDPEDPEHGWYKDVYYFWQTNTAKQPIQVRFFDILESDGFYVYDPSQAAYNGYGDNHNILPYINNSVLNLHYDSESGLLFLMVGDTTLKLLSLTTSTVTGENLVASLSSMKFQIPGQLQHVDLQSLKIIITVSGITIDNETDWRDPITYHARTNVI